VIAALKVVEGGLVRGDHARAAPASIDMLQTVIRASIESARIAAPLNSITYP